MRKQIFRVPIVTFGKRPTKAQIKSLEKKLIHFIGVPYCVYYSRYGLTTYFTVKEEFGGSFGNIDCLDMVTWIELTINIEDKTNYV